MISIQAVGEVRRAQRVERAALVDDVDHGWMVPLADDDGNVRRRAVKWAEMSKPARRLNYGSARASCTPAR